MAVKTITIDMEAYRMLAGAKQEGESFSRVIRRRFRRTTGATLLAHLDDVCLSESALRATESIVRARRTSLAKSPAL